MRNRAEETLIGGIDQNNSYSLLISDKGLFQMKTLEPRGLGCEFTAHWWLPTHCRPAHAALRLWHWVSFPHVTCLESMRVRGRYCVDQLGCCECQYSSLQTSIFWIRNWSLWSSCDSSFLRWTQVCTQTGLEGNGGRLWGAHMYQTLKTNPLFTAPSISLAVQVARMHLKCWSRWNPSY